MQDMVVDRNAQQKAEFDAFKNMSAFEINSSVTKSLKGKSNPKTQLEKEICWQQITRKSNIFHGCKSTRNIEKGSPLKTELALGNRRASRSGKKCKVEGFLR